MILDYEYPVVYFNGDDYEDSASISCSVQKQEETSCAFRAGAWDVSCHT